MLIGQLSQYFFGSTIFITSLFLVLLILVQRGRGGGIAGALGGAGGQSAFGTKAGDLFTRITVAVATFWILLCCAAIYFLKTPEFSTGFSGNSDVIQNSSGAAPTSGSSATTDPPTEQPAAVEPPASTDTPAPAATTEPPAATTDSPAPAATTEAPAAVPEQPDAGGTKPN